MTSRSASKKPMHQIRIQRSRQSGNESDRRNVLRASGRFLTSRTFSCRGVNFEVSV